MKIVIYGLTITSSWGNGHATTYRSLLKALHARGHSILFIEKDVEWYRNNRDFAAPPFCTLRLYEDWGRSSTELVNATRDADVAVVGSYFPDAIAATHALFSQVGCPVIFYDIDTPITLAALRSHGSAEYLRAHDIPQYAAYVSFTGGPTLRELEQQFCAKRAVQLFCSVDPEHYCATAIRPDFASDLSYLGTYAADRQHKLMEFLDAPAASLPERRFLVAGSQYPAETAFHPNVARINHIPPGDHPAFYSSGRFTLNITRKDMVAAGYSPSIRLFEAAACGATILSDEWPGLSDFFTPGAEILTPSNGNEVVDILTQISDEERQRIGRRGRDRVLAEHTSDHRAAEFERIVSGC